MSDKPHGDSEFVPHSFLDPVTGSPNRVHFESKLKEELRRARRDRSPLSLVVLNLDYFKLCNDTLGNRWGDQILKKVYDVLRRKLREIDVCCRLSADEFAVLLPATPIEKAEESARAWLKAISHHRYPGQELFEELFPTEKLTASAGVSALHPQLHHEFDLIAWADFALYRAKRQGRNRVVVQEGPPHIKAGQRNPLEIFEALSRLLPTPQPFAQKLQKAAVLIREWLGMDVCSIYLLEGRELILRASDGLDEHSIGKVRMKTNEGLTGLVIETLTSVCAREAKTHPRYKFFPETGENQLGSYLGVPILYEEDPLGVVVIQTREVQDFSEEQIKVMHAIAGFLAMFLKSSTPIPNHPIP